MTQKGAETNPKHCHPDESQDLIKKCNVNKILKQVQDDMHPRTSPHLSAGGEGQVFGGMTTAPAN